MVNKKSSIIIAAIASLLTLLSVAYVSSCNKPGANKYSCDGVVCLNGGFCDSARCICPQGYEGANCSIPSVAKYVGTWNAMQIITGSDSTKYISDTTYYTAFLKNTATPTTFFIDNFNGNPYFNEVVCVIDSGATNNFVIDTVSGSNMYFGHYFIQQGSGSISTSDSMITATFSVRFINKTTNWQIDTVNIIFTPHL